MVYVRSQRKPKGRDRLQLGPIMGPRSAEANGYRATEAANASLIQTSDTVSLIIPEQLAVKEKRLQAPSHILVGESLLLLPM
jgi:hypothetical protein